VERREIKKLLIDLDLSVAEIARAVSLSRPAIYKYFDNRLRAPAQRAAIQRVLKRRGRKAKVNVPDLWPSR
jgi:AcrR family transcriptional regulator